MKKLIQIMAPLMALGDGFSIPEMKISAKDRRELSDRRKSTPPRSMTEEELAYYKKHKKLS